MRNIMLKVRGKHMYGYGYVSFTPTYHRDIVLRMVATLRNISNIRIMTVYKLKHDKR